MSSRSKRQTHLVELTSKSLKIQLALSGLLLVIGVVLAIGGVAIGYLLGLVGFVWHSVTRVRIWWNHG